MRRIFFPTAILGIFLFTACGTEPASSTSETLPRLADGEYCMAPEEGASEDFISFTVSGTDLEGRVHTTNDDGEKIAFMCFGTLIGDTLAKVHIMLPAIDAELYEEWLILPGPKIEIVQAALNKEGVYLPKPCASLDPESYPVSEFERADEAADEEYSCYGPETSTLQQADTPVEYLTLTLYSDGSTEYSNTLEGWGVGDDPQGFSWASEISGTASEAGVFEVKISYVFKDGSTLESSEVWEIPSSGPIRVIRADEKHPGILHYVPIDCEDRAG